MPLKRSSGFRHHWHEVINPDIPQIFVPFQDEMVGFDRYKLHIYIPSDSSAFYAFIHRLRNLLDEATENKIITGYKYLNVSLFDRFADSERHQRAMNFPYCLYLHNEPTAENLSEVLKLCQKIEKIFENEKKLEEKTLADGEGSDVRLSERFSFRQAAFEKPEYIQSKDPRAKLLVHAAKESLPFTFLEAGLIKSDSVKSLDEKMLEVKSELPPPQVLKNINFAGHSFAKVKRMLEYFLSCTDGKALFSHDLAGSAQALKRCLTEPEMRLVHFVPGILSMRPDLTCFALECAQGMALESLLIEILKSNYLLTSQVNVNDKGIFVPIEVDNIFNHPKIRELVFSPDFNLQLKINRHANLGDKKILMSFLSLGISIDPMNDLPIHASCVGLMQNYQETVKQIEVHDEAYTKSLVDSRDDSTSVLKSVINFLKSSSSTNNFFTPMDPILNKLLKSTNEADAKKNLQNEIKRQLENDIPDPTYLSKLFFIQDKFDPMLRLRSVPIFRIN